MSGALSARITTTRKDYSSSAVAPVNVLAGMVIKGRKGRGDKAVRVQSEKEIIDGFGKPSSTYNSIFESIAYTRTAPAYLVSPYGSGSLFGGVDVKSDSVTSFPIGRDENFLYSSVPLTFSSNFGTGNGVTAIYSGTFSSFPIDHSTIKFYNGTTLLNVTITDLGVVSGDITGTISLTSGTYNLTYTGTPGSVAELTTEIDLSAGIDLSSGGTDKFINLTYQGTLYENINLGQSATFGQADLITAINTAVGSTVATASGTEYVKITGTIGSSTSGGITLDEPSVGDSAYNLVITSSPLPLNAQVASTNPTGAIPAYNQVASVSYTYMANYTNTVSHSILVNSPVNSSDELLSVRAAYLGGSQFRAELSLKKVSSYTLIDTYTYSLIEEVDAFGNSLFYEDVFENNAYIKIKVNPDFTGTTTIPATLGTYYDLTGGLRVMPTDGDITTAWGIFNDTMSYPVRIFIDCFGNQATSINAVINSYAEHAKCFVAIPFGNKGSTNLITAKQGVGINNWSTFYFGNWQYIRDDFNNSKAWVSNIGFIAGQWARAILQSDGSGFITAAGEGLGQISGWTHIKMETEAISRTEYLELDEANVNILVFDKQYGLMIVGDKTSQATLSDTSFIKNSFGYSYILENVGKLVLESKVWKNNNDLTRLLAKSQVELIVNPLVANGWLRQVYVKCDSDNNNDAILAQNKFVLDIYEKVTPNIQKIMFNFVQVGQTQTIAEFVG